MPSPTPSTRRGARLSRGTPVLSLALSVALSAGLFAGPSASAHGQPADAGDAEPGQRLPSIVVTATRSPERIEDLVADVDVIEDDLGRRGLSLQEVLRTAGGLQLTSYGGPAATGNVLIRGANAGHTLTLIEGFRVSSALLGQTTFETLPLAHTGRIEILRGPASGLYGADALGGVVQLFAPSAAPGLQVTGEASSGQQDSRQLQAGLAGGSSALSGGILLSRDSSDGFNATTPANFAYNPDRDGYQREGVSAYADVRPGSATHLRGILLQNRLDSDYDDGAFAGAHVRARTELVGLRGTHEIDPLTQLAFRVGQSEDRSDNFSSFPGRFTSRQLQYGISGTREVIPGIRLQLLLERLEERVQSTSYDDGSTIRRTTNSIGLVLLADQGPHLLQGSLRLDDSDGYGEQTNYSLSYGYRLGAGMRIGASYATGFHAPGFNDLYFPNYGRTVIRPERSRSAEAGFYWNQPAPAGEPPRPAARGSAGAAAIDARGTDARGMDDRERDAHETDARAGGTADASPRRPYNGRWHAKAVLFQSRVRDLIAFAADCPDPSPQFAFGCASNVDKARIEGISLSVGQDGVVGRRGQASGLGWYLNLDFLDPRDVTTGNRLARRAERQLTAGLTYGSGRLTLGGDLVVASRRYDDAANLNELGGYAVINLRAGYRLTPQWEGFATVNNAGDRDYATALHYVQQGRLVMLGVRYRSR
jgi:vitamin B12 transporter